MGRIARILSFVRAVLANGANVSHVTVDPGGGANVTVEHYAGAGDDAYPLETDYVYIAGVPRQGVAVALGYVDPLNVAKANAGDKRIYARDANGVPVCEVWLKNDGSVLVSNDNGSTLLRPDGGSLLTTPASTFDADAAGGIKGANSSGSFDLQAGGDFVVNGVTIDVSGNITTPTTVTAATVTAANVVGSAGVSAAGKALAGHVHLAGTPPGDTGANK